MAQEYVTGAGPNPDPNDPGPGDEKPKSGTKSLKESAELARKWQQELAGAKRWMEKFHRSARLCEKAYMDDGAGSDGTTSAQNEGKVNLFWSNVKVILSAIYGRMPRAEVDRRFKDYKDDVSRVAAIILGRILNGDIEREYDDTNAAMRDAVQDRFISGLGQVWCRYDVETEEYDEPVIDPMTGQPAMDPATMQPLTQKAERIINEEAEVDYVYWDDFRYSPCKRWRDARWVARRVYMSQARLKKRFKLTDAQVAMVPMVTRTPGIDTSQQDDVLKNTPYQQAAVWEVWSKDGNYVCWYCEGCTFLLDRQDDPLGLEGFFPCPQPIVSTTLTKAFLPRPDYAMTQDLYRELDRINARLSNLTAAVKAAGVYDKTAAPARTLLTTGVENTLLPVDNWSAFVEKGGMKGVIDWLPIDQFANAIVQLTQRKAQVERDLYEVLGISDIMRGSTIASETATAQQLKAQYGGARLGALQNDVARFVSGTMGIRANIIANHFQPETLLKRSLIERTDDAPLAQPAIEMLQNYGAAMLSVEVTADSLAAPDWEVEKESRTEFMGACSNFLMAAAPMMEKNPAAGAFLIKLLQWSAAGFRGSRTIEGVLDQAATQFETAAQQPKEPPPPSPEDRKNEAQAKKYDAEADKTKKEAALIPPLAVPPGGPVGQQLPPRMIPGQSPFEPAAIQ